MEYENFHSFRVSKDGKTSIIIQDHFDECIAIESDVSLNSINDYKLSIDKINISYK